MLQSLPVLNARFQGPESYLPAADAAYSLLPFRFITLDSDRYVLSNFVGEHYVLARAALQQLIRHEMNPGSSDYQELKSRHFVIDGDSQVSLDLLAVKYRTKQQLLSQFTGLFLYVVTLRCDHSCPYCQVSRQSTDRRAYDMSAEHADLAIDFMFQSPAPAIKMEFQGGEPLLNFDVIRHIVLRATERNRTESRRLEFVIATNLAFLTEEILEFCEEHRICFSTSLDGPKELHNRNRPRPGSNSYERAVEGIRRVRGRLGSDRVAALMTTTEASLQFPREIIDEYISQDFDSIFLRAVSPYGFAVKTGQRDRYGVDRWLEFYRTALAYIIEINRAGHQFREEYSSLLLRKILTSFPTGYVDLQSPAGLGIGCLVFNYDGGIYASDEARMLAEMGDQKFRIGHLAQDSYEQVMLSPVLIDTLERTMTEGMPMCQDCGFQPYCGSDPIQHYATQGDIVGFKPTSEFCRRNMEVLRHLFRLLEENSAAAEVLMSWVN
jgi:His-Xaa-Ser system radical SAM maturase HxsB